MNRYAFNALRYFAEKGTLTNQYVAFAENFNGKAYCGIDDKLFCGRWMLYYEPLDNVDGYQVDSYLEEGDGEADYIYYSAEMNSNVYLWELNPPKECLKCKIHLKNETE